MEHHVVGGKPLKTQELVPSDKIVTVFDVPLGPEDRLRFEEVAAAGGSEQPNEVVGERQVAGREPCTQRLLVDGAVPVEEVRSHGGVE